MEEAGDDLADLADLPARERVADASDVLVEREHEGLPQRDGRGLRRAEHPAGLLRSHAEWFLAEDRLARLERGDRPLGVQTVGQRDVDGLDLRVRDDLLVARDPARDIVLGRPAAARAPSRLATETGTPSPAWRSAGRKELSAMPAVPRMPQRIGSSITSARGG